MLETTLLGKILRGRFTILKPLGSGGFGETFLAEDGHLPRRPHCVVKRFKPRNLHPDVLQKARELFKREAEVLDELGVHDRIPRLIAHFDEEIEGNQEFFLVQEYVEGHDLAHEIRADQPLPEEKVVPILQDVLQTLEFVHQRGAIHRDIKPANLIRRNQDDNIILIDFGAVKQEVKTFLVSGHAETTLDPLAPTPPSPERHETIIGSPGFVAPEQLKGKPVWASDIYSLGMVGITALTGISADRLPEDPHTGEVLWRDRVSVSSRLAEVLDKMVRHRRTERYQTATEALQALNLALQPTPSRDKKIKFSMPPIAALGLLALLLFGGGGYWFYNQAASGGSEVADCPVPGAPSGLFNYGGSTTWAPIQRDANPRLETLCPQFRLRYTEPPGEEVPGSSTGVRMLQQGQIDFALSSRPLESSETQDNQGVMLKQVGVAIDGIAIVVHPDLEIAGLTVEQVRDIYTGQITNWKQVGGPDRPITPYSRRSEAGGTVEFFVQHILQGQALKAKWVSRTTEGIQTVAADLGGIYYASAPEVIGQCGVKPLPIGRQANQLVAPYQEPLVPPSDCPAKRNQVNLAAFQVGEYPITRKLFVVIKEDGGDEQRAGEAYIGFLLTPQGQGLIEQAGFVRIR